MNDASRVCDELPDAFAQRCLPHGISEETNWQTLLSSAGQTTYFTAPWKGLLSLQ